jgi:hypothetical protein
MSSISTTMSLEHQIYLESLQVLSECDDDYDENDDNKYDNNEDENGLKKNSTWTTTTTTTTTTPPSTTPTTTRMHHHHDYFVTMDRNDKESQDFNYRNHYETNQQLNKRLLQNQKDDYLPFWCQPHHPRLEGCGSSYCCYCCYNGKLRTRKYARIYIVAILGCFVIYGGFQLYGRLLTKRQTMKTAQAKNPVTSLGKNVSLNATITKNP